jgi:hypothetical protein
MSVSCLRLFVRSSTSHLSPYQFLGIFLSSNYKFASRNSKVPNEITNHLILGTIKLNYTTFNGKILIIWGISIRFWNWNFIILILLVLVQLPSNISMINNGKVYTEVYILVVHFGYLKIGLNIWWGKFRTITLCSLFEFKRVIQYIW